MPAKRFWNPHDNLLERQPDRLVSVCEQPGIMLAPHWHAQAEVNYVVRGALDYEMQGYRVRLDAGALALFWGGLPHQVVDTAEDTLYHVVHLPLVHFFRLRLAPDLQRRIVRGATLLTNQPQPEDAAAFDRRCAWLAGADPRLIGHALDELLLRLERIALQEHRVAERGSPAVLPTIIGAEQPGLQAIRRICGFIAENFREEIRCADIAAAVGLHPNYVMTAFRRATGLSLGGYLSLLRISHAQALLLDDGVNVLQAAMDSGFGSISAFNKCFRKTTGTTPSEFKRQRQGMGS